MGVIGHRQAVQAVFLAGIKVPVQEHPAIGDMDTVMIDRQRRRIAFRAQPIHQVRDAYSSNLQTFIINEWQGQNFCRRNGKKRPGL